MMSNVANGNLVEVQEQRLASEALWGSTETLGRTAEDAFVVQDLKCMIVLSIRLLCR